MAPSGYECKICGGANWNKPKTCAFYRYIFYKLKKNYDFTNNDESSLRKILSDKKNKELLVLLGEWILASPNIRINSPRKLIGDEGMMNDTEKELLIRYYTNLADLWKLKYIPMHCTSNEYEWTNKICDCHFKMGLICNGSQECYETEIICGVIMNNKIVYTRGQYHFYNLDGFMIDNTVFWPRSWNTHFSGPYIDKLYCRTCWKIADRKEELLDPSYVSNYYKDCFKNAKNEEAIKPR